MSSAFAEQSLWMASLALTLLLIVTHWDTKPAHHMDDETEMEFTLRRHHRNSLLEANRDALLRVVGNSPLRVLVLNGAGVVRGFERAFGTCLIPIHSDDAMFSKPDSLDSAFAGMTIHNL